MKIFFLLLATLIILGWQKEPGKKKVKVELVPYGEVYSNDTPLDTLCPDGTFLRNLVNRDTTDRNLYLTYGSKDKRRIYSVEEGLDLPLCSRPRFMYATSHSIAMLSDCASFQQLLLLSLHRSPVATERFTPLYINVNDSILFVQDERLARDKFLLLDLDNRKRQEVFLAPMIENVTNRKQKAIDCLQVNKCLEEIFYERGNLYVKFLARSIDADHPDTVSKKIKVQWK
ncbi:MAG: hypothetical protein Q8916_14325 [Bacteroidota bacterium]|nr:hypothetical protein [Bacteroidota bacterium]MDP4231571.1 hypothetical protein [Bacteroidota bacterium]MDP4235960.1 hypothetical protein [Bacteroidota bacterium]